MKIAVLGCGPAGLLAAEAIEGAGHSVAIFSRKIKSEIFGAQYLHQPIPGLTGSTKPDHKIDVIKSGTAEGYRQLVYGPHSDISVSWDRFEAKPTYGWNMRDAYDEMWERFEQSVTDILLDAPTLHHISSNFPLVYSTVPMPSICTKEHVFKHQPIFVHCYQGGLIEDGDMMYYNGFPPDGSVDKTVGPAWYRYSQLNGFRAWEYSGHRRSTLFERIEREVWEGSYIVEGKKPLSHKCDCWPNIRRVGRFGSWDRQVLSHDVFFQVRREVDRLNKGVSFDALHVL